MERRVCLKILILGLGQYPKGSGISAALFFARQGAEVLVSDFYYTPAMAENVRRLTRFKNVRFSFKKHPTSEVRNMDLVVKHQRARRTEPELIEARKRGIPVETAESLFLKLCPCPIVGITGTRGKSTTTALVAEMLKESGKQAWLGGNILISPLTFLKKIKPRDIVVLELSSFQLEGTGEAGISPHVACVTNLLRDHLNAYSGMEEYAEAKAQIFRHQLPDDIVVLNGDDAYGRRWIKEVPGGTRVFTRRKMPQSDAWIEQGRLVLCEQKKLVSLIHTTSLKLRGEHNSLNALAAALTARAAGATIPAIRQALNAFSGLPDRQEIVATIGGVTYVNDTTATTPDGTIAALRTFAKPRSRIRIILGGADKELKFEELARELRRVNADVVVLPGTAHAKLTQSLRRAHLPSEDVGDLRAAVQALRSRARRGDIVLLSPACASFGLFKNEFERGRLFKKIVHSLR